jgi:torsin-1
MHYQNENPSKPMMISFYGTPGIGKNYVGDFFVKSFYKKDLRSKYVHIFFGRFEYFPT